MYSHGRSGLCAIALAKNAGVYVAATSHAVTAKDQIISAGADEFILDDGKIAETLQRGQKFDQVLELIGPVTLADSLQCAAPKTPGSTRLARVCQTGIVGGKWTFDHFEVMAVIPQGVALTTYSGGNGEFQRTPFAEIVKKVEQGKLEFPIGQTFKLEDAWKAHDLMEKGGAGGKMVLLMHLE